VTTLYTHRFSDDAYSATPPPPRDDSDALIRAIRKHMRRRRLFRALRAFLVALPIAVLSYLYLAMLIGGAK
jgi:hypothetical protein